MGPCAKKRVRCEILTLNGDVFTGTNDCRNPQKTCPRAGDEGYDKCITICDQLGHAEVMALRSAKEAGADLNGATASISGIGHYCRNCQDELFGAGVKYLTLKD